MAFGAEEEQHVEQEPEEQSPLDIDRLIPQELRRVRDDYDDLEATLAHHLRGFAREDRFDKARHLFATAVTDARKKNEDLWRGFITSSLGTKTLAGHAKRRNSNALRVVGGAVLGAGLLLGGQHLRDGEQMQADQALVARRIDDLKQQATVKGTQEVVGQQIGVCTGFADQYQKLAQGQVGKEAVRAERNCLDDVKP